ncbi:MAG TPA: ATP-binding protein [Xanthomonadales bacterium]|nr:ATP-binding protein [Xanthomonadales bacterium]
MSLRNRLLALSLLTLLLPWSGWKLLQELERFLREAQETSLLATARTLAATLPFEQLSQLQFLPQNHLMVRQLQRAPELDGYDDDWQEAEHGLEMLSADKRLALRLLAGSSGSALYLLFDVSSTQALNRPGDLSEYGVEILLRSPRGLQRFEIRPEAPGPLQLRGEMGQGQFEGQAEGFWLETATGYRLELALPGQSRLNDFQFRLQYPAAGGGSAWLNSDQSSGQSSAQSSTRSSGQSPGQYTGSGAGRSAWLHLTTPWLEVSRSLAATAPEATRAWLVDRQGWVLADSGEVSTPTASESTWLQRLPYRWVAGGRTEQLSLPNDPALRLQQPPASLALLGEATSLWSQDPETAVLSNTVAVPIISDDRVLGAIVLQSSSDGLLLLTNRALGRLLLTTLVITFGLAIGLWFFATRLSHRVRRLANAVTVAMDDGSVAARLPLTRDRDELGELARNNEQLLQAVADYNSYLQTLAGKLSHELKTPLAITRSSLENLSTQPLDGDSRRFLQRAQEGVERQTAIVRAMSEASRLEAAIGSADWETIDLATWLQHCAEGYRSVHPDRRIETRLTDGKIRFHCAPELLAQALDKLVDNAISLSGPQDSVSLQLQVQADHLVLSVQNTGTRLPEEFQGRLFNSLVSLRDKASTGSHLGLGLYIVRLVAQAHHGQASARNLPNQAGVEFSLKLPLRMPNKRA